MYFFKIFFCLQFDFLLLAGANHLGIKKYEAKIGCGNKASLSLFHKLGFVEVCIKFNNIANFCSTILVFVIINFNFFPPKSNGK